MLLYRIISATTLLEYAYNSVCDFRCGYRLTPHNWDTDFIFVIAQRDNGELSAFTICTACAREKNITLHN